MTPATCDLRLAVPQPSKTCREGIQLYTHSGQYHHSVASRGNVTSFCTPETNRKMLDNVLVIFQKGTDAQIFYFSFPKNVGIFFPQKMPLLQLDKYS